MAARVAGLKLGRCAPRAVCLFDREPAHPPPRPFWTPVYGKALRAQSTGKSFSLPSSSRALARPSNVFELPPEPHGQVAAQLDVALLAPAELRLRVPDERLRVGVAPVALVARGAGTP